MLRLIRTEFRRFFHRRMFAYALLGVIAVVGITLFSVHSSSAPPSPDEITQAQQYVAEEAAWAEEYLAPGGQCEQDAAETGDDPASVCQPWEMSNVEDYLSQSAYSEYGPQTQEALAGLLLFFALAIGVSFITAEISSGALSNWLTFAPRRIQVYLSKAIVLAIIAAIFAAVFQVVTLLGFRIIANMNDALGTNPNQVSEQMTEAAWRIVIVTVMAVLVGYVVGVIARHAAVGIGAVVLIGVVDPLIGALFRNSWRFTLTPRIRAWLSGEYTVYDESICTAAWNRGEICSPEQVVITQGQAGWQLLALTVVLLVIGAVVIKRRDVA